MSSENQYDAIAEAYKNSKQLPFREYIEAHTLFEILGDIRGQCVLDLACGEGFYTRKIKQARARAVTGVDISAEMIKLAEEEERVRPLGLRVTCIEMRRISTWANKSTLAVAMYLLNYAKTPAELLRFVEVAYRNLRPGGRFVGFQTTMSSRFPRGTVSFPQYGFDKTCANAPPQEGDVILYRVKNEDGTAFEFENYFLKPETYHWAFQPRWICRFSMGRPVHPSVSAGQSLLGCVHVSPPNHWLLCGKTRIKRRKARSGFQRVAAQTRSRRENDWSLCLTFTEAVFLERNFRCQPKQRQMPL